MIFTRKEKPLPLLKERGILFEDCLKNCFRFQRVCFTLNNKLTPFPSGEGWGEASGYGERLQVLQHQWASSQLLPHPQSATRGTSKRQACAIS